MDKFEKKQNIITGLDMETGEKLPAGEIKKEGGNMVKYSVLEMEKKK